MAKQLVGNYTYSKAGKTITLTDWSIVRIDRLLLVVDASNGAILYNFADPTIATVTATGSSNIFTFSTLAGASTEASDKLMIFYDVLTADTSYDRIKVDGSAVTQPVSGSVSASQVGTWTVQPGNTANTTAWKVDASSVAVPVTDNSGSLTVDQPTGTNLHTVVDSGTITTITNTVTVDTELTPAAALADAVANPTITNIWALGGVFNGTTWDRLRSGKGDGVSNVGMPNVVLMGWNGSTHDRLKSDTTYGLQVNSKRGPAPATVAQTSPSITTTSTAVIPTNANRMGATIWNEGSQLDYLKLGATASTTSYSVQLASGGYYEVPFGYTGQVDGITSTSTAQLRVTELTA